jgi:nitrite reductase/ring-hydroxylating ferredoxin subunit
MIAVGQYHRDLGASVARMIENALDWEHLPHLHASSFADIQIASADDQGWTADATISSGGTIQLDLRLDPDRLGWVTTSSVDGTALSRIETRTWATGPDSCAVAVTFLVADAAPEARDAIGESYIRLYTQLYDEDEAMMIARAEAIRAGAAAHAARRDVAMADGTTASVPLACPHLGLPLTSEPDADGVLTCPWHGYRFDVRTGQCISGQDCSWRVAA